MAKRIEELEAQVRVMAGLLREARKYVTALGKPDDEVSAVQMTVSRIDALLAGQVPAPAAAECWQLVPVEPTDDMFVVGGERLFDCVGPWEGDDDTTVKEQDLAATIYRAMLASAPSPGTTK